MNVMKLLFILNLIILPICIFSQNCSVNAGLEGKWCAGAKIMLDGAVAGTLTSGQPPIWSLVSGPGPVSIEDSSKLKTFAVAQVAGDYIFQLTAHCGSGLAFQQVKHIVSGGAFPDAGEDVYVDCFDSDFTLALSGNAPSQGFTAKWSVPNGSVQDNIYKPSFNDLENCPNTLTSYVLNYVMVDQNNCTYSDAKAILFKEYVPPLKLGWSGGCGLPFKLGATCTGDGMGVWSFISPADGGGASFESPNQRVTGILNGDTNQIYKVRFTITGSCHDQTETLEFAIIEDSEDASQADFENIYSLSQYVYQDSKGKTIVYTAQFCGIPDSLLVLAKQSSLKEGETTSWYLTKANCSVWYGEIGTDPLINYPDDFSAIIDNLDYGSYSLTYKVINKAGCETTAIFNMIINQTTENTIYFLSNECGGDDYNKNNYYHYSDPVSLYNPFRIYDNTYMHFTLPYKRLPKNGQIHPLLQQNNYKPITSPSGGELISAVFNIVFNLTNHKFEYYLNMPVSAPSGQYIFQIPYTYSCGNYATLVVDFSSPPEKVNGGTDLYICGNSGALVGNDRSAPEWILMSKKPEGIPDPVMEGINTRYLQISNLSPQSEYIFGYVSRGGAHCPDIIDSVKVGVADIEPPKPNAGQDQNTCAFSSINLNATPADIPYGTYGYWEVVSQNPSGMPPSIKNLDQPNTQVFNLQPNTVYVFRFTLENKCGSNSDEVMVTINEIEGPPPAYAGFDRCLEVGTTNLTLSAGNVNEPFIGLWEGLSNNPSGYLIDNLADPKTGISGLVSGTYGFIWKIEGAGCSATSDTVLITIGSSAQTKAAEIILCNQELPATVTLNAIPATGGYWVSLNIKPGIITDPSNASTTVTGLEEGIYYFRWYVGEGLCAGYADVKVTIGKSTPQADAGADILICSNSDGTVTLDANLPEGATGYWTMINVDNITPSAGFSYVSGGQFDPKSTIKVKPGRTRFKWTILSNDFCSQDLPFDDVLISYFSESIEECCPKLCTNDYDQILCNLTPSPIILDELLCPGTDSGTWSLTSGPSVSDPISLFDTLSLYNKLPGNYVVTYTLTDTLEGCPSSTSEVITLLEQPSKPTEISFSICPKELYLLPNGSIVTEPGIYSDTLHTTSGCDSIIITTLTIKDQDLFHNILVIESNPSDTLPKGSKVVLTITNAEPGAEYRWYKNNILIGPSGTSIEVEVDLGKDVYSAEMVSPTEMFCSGDGSIEIVGIIPKLIMPNAFTPNNDGVNDRFRAVIDPGVEIVKLTVVSRWGQTMYSEAGNDGWDGKYSGKDAPSDTYIYSISYRFFGSEEFLTQRGEALLLR